VFGIMFLIPDTLPILLKCVTVKYALSEVQNKTW